VDFRREYLGRLVGAPPQRPGAFFRALLERDNASSSRIFFSLSQLDRSHQAFFTATPSAPRVSLSSSRHPGMQRRASTGYSHIQEFLRSFLSITKIHVEFPGRRSVAVVKGARGTRSTTPNFSSAFPGGRSDIEDEVLLRLAQTHYKDKIDRHTELDNFLAVSRIDAHRTTPLDDESASSRPSAIATPSKAISYSRNFVP